MTEGCAISSCSQGRSTSALSSKAAVSTTSASSRSVTADRRTTTSGTSRASTKVSGVTPISRLVNRCRPCRHGAPTGTRIPHGTPSAAYQLRTASTSTRVGSSTSPLFHCACGNPVADSRTPGSSWVAVASVCHASPCASRTHVVDGSGTRHSVADMEYRHLGRSGLLVTEISYGNWLTHGSQVEEEQALACVRAALDNGITTFDTADVYARTKAESVLGRALKGERRDGLEIFTKVFWPTQSGPNDVGLSRKHILRSIDRSLERLQTDYVDLYQAHRYDHTAPLEETMLAFADIVRAGKALYIGVSEWRAEEIRAAKTLADELHVPLVSNQPQYNALWRVIEAEVVPTCEELGLSQVVWSPIAQGALTGKYKPGEQPPEGSRATDEAGGANMIKRWLDDDILRRVQQLQPIADELGLSMAQLAVAWVLQNDNVASAIVGASRPEQVVDNVKASGVKLEAAALKQIDDVLGDAIERDPAKTQSPRSPR